MSRQEFIEYIAGLVINQPSDFFNSVTIAQACLESNYGQSVLYKGFNNAFGYKAKNGEWNGKIAGDYKSNEEVNGVLIKDVPSDFRAYDSVKDSVKDHAYMMTSRGEGYKTIYAEAINAKTPEEQAHALTHRYAGDSLYGEKLMAIIINYNLEQYDEPKKGVAKMGYIGIDIGHGANTRETGGGKAVYVGGVWHEEHDFNSKVAVRLNELLTKSGHKTTYGVQGPFKNEVGLSARTDKFNALNVDLMISIHANYISNANVNGICAFYWHDHAGSKKYAKLVMDEYRKQGQTIYGGGEIASLVGSWTNFHMLRETKMSAVLMELGFMSGNRDFDKVFGKGQSAYVEQMAVGMANAVNKYFGLSEVVGEKPVSTYNPQGLKSTPLKPYVAPRLPWDKLKVGDTVTLAKNWQWVDLAKRELLQSKKYDELLGKQDKIAEVKTIEGGNHSKVAYRLEKYNSWILQEYLEESSASWELVQVEPAPEGQPDTPALELLAGEYVDKDGVVWIWKKK